MRVIIKRLTSSLTHLFLYISLACSFLTSCGRTEIEENPWGKASVPAVYSILSPDDTIKVFLLQTYSTSSPTLKSPYSEARVYIGSEDNSWKELHRMKADTCVFVDTTKSLVIEKGKTYRLRIDLSTQTVTALTTVPNSVATITDATYTPKSDPMTYYDKAYTSGDIHLSYSLPETQCVFIATFSAKSNLWSSTSYALSGNSYTLKDVAVLSDTTEVDAIIQTLNPELYKSLQANNITELSSGFEGGGGFLQAFSYYGGTLPRYSNINNGVGIFSSYCSAKRKIRKL